MEGLFLFESSYVKRPICAAGESRRPKGQSCGQTAGGNRFHAVISSHSLRITKSKNHADMARISFIRLLPEPD